MRICIFCIVILTSVAGLSQNQPSEVDKIEFGVRFGLSLSDLVTSSNTVQPRATFLIGIHANYKINSIWSIQPELLYLRKGESVRTTASTNTTKIENRILLNYIEMPILAKYKFIQDLHLEAGPYFSSLVAAKQEDIEGENFQSNSIKNDISSFDMGFAFGASYVTEWNFFVGLRYTRGFIDVSENQNNFTESYHTQLQLYVGYSF